MPDQRAPLRIEDFAFERGAEYDEASALIGECRVWFRVTPGHLRGASADAFLALALLAGMASNRPLELAPTYAVSPLLLENLNRLQEIFNVWNPAFHRVPVSAATAASPAARSGTGTFFSGGVDSLYTYLKHEARITHLVQIHGYDYRHGNRSLAQESETRNRAFAQKRGKALVIVETNVRELFEAHNVHIYAYHGGYLACVAHLLGFERYFIPSSFPWTDLEPWGSHSMTDPLWRSEAVELIHDGGEAKRYQKVQRLGADVDALALLRVCPRNNTYNCGLCEKCLRTRVALRLLGLSCPGLAPLDDVRPVRSIHLDAQLKRANWVENMELAVAVGDRPLAKAISVSLAKFDLHRTLRSLDQAYLGGLLRRLSSRFGGGAGPKDPLQPRALEVTLDQLRRK